MIPPILTIIYAEKACNWLRIHDPDEKNVVGTYQPSESQMEDGTPEILISSSWLRVSCSSKVSKDSNLFDSYYSWESPSGSKRLPIE